MTQPQLRPIERVVQRLGDEGVELTEIATRLRKSPRAVRQIQWLVTQRLEGKVPAATARSGGLTPLERCVERHLAAGETHGRVGSRIGRSGNHVRQIERFATFKRTGELAPRVAPITQEGI